jgi:hypothetical protein
MLKLSLETLLTSRELQKEKAKDYRNIVLMQVTIVVMGLTLSGPFIEDPTSETSKLIITIFSAFAAIYAFLLWDLLRNFTRSTVLIISVFVVLAFIIILGILGEFPYYQIIHIENRQGYLLLLHGILFPVEITVIAFTIRDLFSGSFLTSDKLWGAACVFLMIGISFGSLYDLITIANPGSLGINVDLGFPNYSECVTYSFCILGGMDSGLETSRLIRNISVIEAVWANLYGILIIGKLLGLPRLEKDQETKN